MSLLSEAALGLVGANLDRILLFALLPLTVLVLRQLESRSRRRPDARSLAAMADPRVRDAALGLLAFMGLWAGWSLAAARSGLDQATWAGPLDRLLCMSGIALFGWLAMARSGVAARRWRLMLAGGFLTMFAAYLVWAPRWALAYSGSSPAADLAVSEFPRMWDASQAALGLFASIAILLVGARAPRWLQAAVGALALGSALDLFLPLSGAHQAYVPVWTRLGMLGAGLLVAGASVEQAWLSRDPNAGLPKPELDPELASLSHWRRRIDQSMAGLSERLPKLSTLRLPKAKLSIPRPSAGSSGSLSTVLEALREQSLAITDLQGGVAQLAGRVDALEQFGPEDPATELAGEREIVTEADLAQAPTDVLEAAPQALSERLARYESALSHLPMGILMTDPHGRIAYHNASAAALLEDSALLDQPLGEILGRHGASGEGLDLDEALRRAIQDPNASQGLTGQLRLDAPDLEIELFGLRPPPAHSIVGILAVVAPPGTEGRRLGRRLLPELIEGLRAPMTSILGYSHLLQDGSSLNDSQVRRYLAQIDANLARLQVMLDNLDLVLDSAAGAERAVNIDLAGEINAALSRAEHQLAEKGLSADPRLEVSSFRGRKRLVDLILDNLLVHAARRSPQGGDVQVAARKAEAGSSSRELILAVRDRGRAIGRQDELAQGLIDIDLESDQAESGIGLELRVVRLLAELHGGRAWVENDAQGAQAQVALRELD